MKTKYLFMAAIGALTLVSCADESFVGDQEALSQDSSGTISFSSDASSMTRAGGAEAAEKLKYKFKVFGMKTVSAVDQRVFATAESGVTPYDVWYLANTSKSTTSNSSNWEYVGSNGGVYGTTSNQVTLGAEQTIKYWDFNATEYNFQAWSDVNASPSVTVSAITKQGMTLSGTPTALSNFWISDLQSDAPGNFTNHVVQFTFRKAATKVRLGIYETVPGYNVRNLKFYYTPKGESETNSAAAADAASHATLTGKFVGASASSATSFDVTYDASSKRAIITPSDGASNTEHFDFGTIGTNNTTVLGETASSPTWAGGTEDYTYVFPNTAVGNIANMVLKVDYELYNDISKEVIAVTGKTAIVPAAYMTWKPNYAYTYLFKITDDLLTPITLDAVVVEDGEGNQETITTVTDPSITTYAKASAVVTDNEYKKNNNIYVAVQDGATNPALTVGTNAELYSVTLEAGALQKITEASVTNAISNGVWDGSAKTFTVTDAAGKNLVVTKSDLLSAITSIPAEDSPTGAALTINGAKFKPTSAGTYVVRYMKTAPVYDSGTVLAVGTSLHGYYTEAADVYTQCNSAATADGATTYYKITTAAVYQYKVIIVVD